MRSILSSLLLLVSVCALAQNKSLIGFSPAAAEAHTQAEAKFDSYLKAKNIDDWIKRLSARPHHVGSPYGKENAEFMVGLFRSWGYEAEIETYYVLFPSPKVRVLEMVSPTAFKAKLEEPALKEDATSGQKSEQLPIYNCWSPDGEVTAELVYVNYGVPDDYEQLERMGIDVKGKIVIAKYGGSWRGIKPKVAQEHGAIGCIIYSDPAGDGYAQGDVYPKGAYKNQYGAQRGSVLDMPIYPGDPLTPNYGSTKEAKRIDRSEAKNLLKIPVIPISYGDAQPLLQALGGPVAPEKWRGALPITYHIGPGPSKVHLKLAFNWDTKPAYNVIAKLRGTELQDEWVIRGNHHDAWVNGANDPVSGMAALMEEARAVGELVKSGWKPKRTIIYCAWDAEEPSLMGSTEWVEDHWDELVDKTVAYINSDSNGRGFLFAEGSHTLEPLMSGISKDVIDPQTGISLFERRKSLDASNASSVKAKKDILARKSLSIGALGAGSDYSPFIQHLGIASLNLGFGGENGGGEYHSVYDSYDHYKRFKDPTFEYGVALAKTAGRATLRIANAEVLPFDFAAFHKTVNTYVTEVTTLLDNLRESTEIENQMIREKRYVLAQDPTEKYVPPVAKESVPYLNFSSLQNAILQLEKSTAKYAELAAANPNPLTNRNQLNELLYKSERKLLVDAGLPRRAWYKHTIYAPGFYTGYGVKTLPGVREAIEQCSWKEAQEQIEIAAKALENFNQQVEAASKILIQR
ncbi:MAG: M28 family metallopeptidase [Cyclobacteriaceae bacterium]|jgi:N-acetylated-alpha-linked acidic dipeptidase|nr:M28 family metallopeptidase [Flammeovirgaceae bacterium]